MGVVLSMLSSLRRRRSRSLAVVAARECERAMTHPLVMEFVLDSCGKGLGSAQEDDDEKKSRE